MLKLKRALGVGPRSVGDLLPKHQRTQGYLQQSWLGAVKQMLKGPMTMDEISRQFPPLCNAPQQKNWQQLPHVKQMQQMHQQYSSCPVCLDQGGDLIVTSPINSVRKMHYTKDVPGGTSRAPLPERPSAMSAKQPAHVCPKCMMPSHCSHEHLTEDQTHSLVCSVIAASVEDAVDLQSSRPKWELNFPTTELAKVTNGTTNVLNWTSWRTMFRSRSFPRVLYQSGASAPNAPMLDVHQGDTYTISRRLVSSLLTHVCTVASIIGGRPWLYYTSDDLVDYRPVTDGDSETVEYDGLKYNAGAINPVTDNGWHLLSSLSQAIDITRRTNESAKQRARQVQVRNANAKLKARRAARFVRMRNAILSPVDSKQMLDSTTTSLQLVPPSQLTDKLLQSQLTNPAIFRLFVIDASAECHIPLSAWEQLTHTFGDNVPFQIYFIGQDVAVPKAVNDSQFKLFESKAQQIKSDTILQRRKSDTRRTREHACYIPTTPRTSRDLKLGEGKTVKQLTYSVSNNLRLTYIKSQYTAQLHEALQTGNGGTSVDRFRPSRDVFVMFNANMGIFEDFVADNKPANFDTQAPTFAHDVFADTLSGNRPPPRGGPSTDARVMKRQVNYANKYRSDWHETIEVIASTRCMMLGTAYNQRALTNDMRFFQENFNVTSPALQQGEIDDDKEDKRTRLDFIMHPCTNKFSSMSAGIPFDALGEPELWTQCNAYVYALQGAGSDLTDTGDSDLVEQRDEGIFGRSWFSK